VCQVLGAEPVRQKPGVNATGLAFNSLTSVERSEGKWAFLAGGLSRFAGRELTLSDEVYASASGTSHRNRAIANLLASRDRIYWDPAETVDLYTRQSCLLTSAGDLAVMTATLADGGVNPVTGIRVITPTPASSRRPSWRSPGCTRPRVTGFSTLACPGKSGTAGGIIAVSPGKGGTGTFSPLSERVCHEVPCAARGEQVCAGRSVDAARIARTNGRYAVWPVRGSYQVAAAKDLAGAGVNGERQAAGGQVGCGQTWRGPSRRQEEPRRAEGPIWPMVPDASQRDVTPAFRISSTQGSEGSRTLRGLIHPDNGKHVCCHLVQHPVSPYAQPTVTAADKCIRRLRILG
jgi:hypothetical protein